MRQILKPKFRFGLYLILDQNQMRRFQSNSMTNPIVCYADTFDIKDDGSIIFYHTLQVHDADKEKNLRLPVLSYPNGKWESCVLLDDKNHMPVFQNNASIDIQVMSPINLSKENVPSQNAAKEEFDSSDLTFDSNSSPFGNSTNSSFGGNQPAHLGSGPSNNSYINMPGVGQNNTQEFKKQKNEWLEKHIKEYSKGIDHFEITSFMKYLQKESQYKTFKPLEDDITWKASALIRDKSVLARKFSDPTTQKILALNLNDIMKRQWAGKMSPIIETLQDREETKNVTAIDVAVWMINHNFQT